MVRKNDVRRLIAALTLVALGGCGGGGGGGDETAELTIRSMAPADGATGVDTASVLTMDFSAVLDAGSVPANVALTAGSGNVPGAVAVSGSRATFTPAAPLALLTPHTATVDVGVSGSDGEKLAAAQTIRFTTRDGTWQGPRSIANAISAPQLAVDRAGNALAVWEEIVGGSGSGSPSVVRASRSDAPGDVWAAPQTLMAVDGGTGDVDVAMNGVGDGIAAWSTCIGGIHDVFVSRYSAATKTWQAPASIGTESCSGPRMVRMIALVRVSIDAAGNAIVAWSKLTETDVLGHRREAELFVRRFSASSGEWGSPLAIPDVVGFDVGLGEAGDAVVLWERMTAGSFIGSIWATRSPRNGASWSEAQRVDGGSGFAARPLAGTSLPAPPKLAVDGAGNAVAVWIETSNVFASRLDAASGAWGAVTRIGADETEVPTELDLALDGAGNAAVVWRDFSASRNVHMNRFAAATGAWGLPQSVSAVVASGDFVQRPQVGLDALGNALVVWEQFRSAEGQSPVPSIRARRQVVASGTWGNIELISGPDEGGSSPDLVIDGKGRALAGWGRAGQLWVNSFR